MTELAISRTPEVIAAEINVIKAQTREVVCKSAIEIGRRLVEAKCCVPHGSWGAWLEENVEYSERTAQDLMKMYEEYGNANPQAIADLSYTQALLLTRLDGETRAELLEKENVADMSTRELQAEIARLNEEAIKRQLTIEQLMNRADAMNEEAAKAVVDLEAERAALMELRGERDQAKMDAVKAQDQAKDAVDRANRISEENKRLKDELREERSKPEPQPIIEQIEVTPPEVERELSELRRRVQAAPNEDVVKLRVVYAQLIETFGTVKKLIDALEDAQPEEAARYRKAVAAAAQRMAEQIG